MKEIEMKNLEKIFDPSYSETFGPIENFKFNILKARILYETSQEMQDIYPKIHNKIFGPNRQDKGTTLNGAFTIWASYFTYTEQSLVSVISASEIYLRDKLEYEIQNNKNILYKLSKVDKEEGIKNNKEEGIKIDLNRILDVGLNETYNTLDLTDNIGLLLVENKDFQNLDNVQRLYAKAFESNGSKFQLFGEKEFKKNLEKIFKIRHLITHKGGIVDQKFQKFLIKNDSKLLDFELETLESDHLEVGKRLIFSVEDILKIIDFIEEIIIDLDQRISNI